jgi:hypothetical protein
MLMMWEQFRKTHSWKRNWELFSFTDKILLHSLNKHLLNLTFKNVCPTLNRLMKQVEPTITQLSNKTVKSEHFGLITSFNKQPIWSMIQFLKWSWKLPVDYSSILWMSGQES